MFDDPSPHPHPIEMIEPREDRKRRIRGFLKKTHQKPKEIILKSARIFRSLTKTLLRKVKVPNFIKLICKKEKLDCGNE